MAQQLMVGKFPKITYSIIDANALTFDTVYEGLIVVSDEGKLGIVTGINKKFINVYYTNGIGVSGPPQLFKTSNGLQLQRMKLEPESKEINFNLIATFERLKAQFPFKNSIHHESNNVYS